MVCSYWEVESTWTVRTFAEAMHREHRRPEAVVHDHGTHFMRHFPRAIRVLEIEEELTPAGLPSMNCYAERAIGSVRRELLRYIRPRDADHLQELLDGYRAYANGERAHQGIEGSSPEERAAERPLPPVLSLDELRQRRLIRRDYASGLLHGYELALDEPTQRAACVGPGSGGRTTGSDPFGTRADVRPRGARRADVGLRASSSAVVRPRSGAGMVAGYPRTPGARLRHGGSGNPENRFLGIWPQKSERFARCACDGGTLAKARGERRASGMSASWDSSIVKP